MASDIKLIAIDLDGTLVHDAHHIPERNLRALQMVMDRGVTVAIATGRMHDSARRFVGRLGIGSDTPIISYNGAMIRLPDGGQPLHHVPVPAEAAVEIVQHAVEQCYHLNYYLDDVMYMTHLDHWAWLYHRRTGDFPSPVGDLRRFNGSEPTKLLIEDYPPRIDELLPVLQERFSSKVYVTRSMPEYIEFLNQNATKGTAVEWLAAHLGLQREQCMAMGDMLNDLTMIQWAGVGVAMPKAEQLVRDAADFIPEHEEEGVAEALEHFFG